MKLKHFNNFFRLKNSSIILLLILLLCLISVNPVFASDPLDQWAIRSPLPTGNGIMGISYGNNTFVAVGDSGTILTSSNGTTWSSRSSGTINGACSPISSGR